MDDLLQALQAQLQGLPQPQYSPTDVFRMQQEALMNANRAGRMRTPVSGAGPLGAVVNYLGRKRGNESEQAALDQLVKAMEAQSGIGQYEKQVSDIQARIADIEKYGRDLSMYEAKKGIDSRYAPAPKPEKPTFIELLDPETGVKYKWTVGPDGMPDKRVGMTERPKPKDTQAPAGMEANPDADSGKVADIDEALSILDEAETMLDNPPTFMGVSFRDTGPLDQFFPGQYTQQFDSVSQRLFAVAKRIYKTKGEGQFSDADAEALRGMLINSGRYSDVNREIIRALRESLQQRRPSFAQFRDRVSQIEADGGDEYDRKADEIISRVAGAQ